MAQVGDICRPSIDAELSQKRIVIKIVQSLNWHCRSLGKKSLMIKRFDQTSALVQFAKTIKADRIQPLEDITIFPVQGRSPMLSGEFLNFLEPHDDALLPWRPAGDDFRFDLDAELVEKCVILFGVFRHGRLPPSCGRGRQPLRPSASPRRPVT